jgi:hypothetical protein
MHKEKNFKNVIQGIFLLGTQKESIFGIFSWMLIFKNTSNVILLDVFYR